MNEFLRQNYFLLTHSVEFLAAVTGLFCLKKYKSTAAKYFIYFLIYSFFVDFLGRYPDHLIKLNRFNLIKSTIFEHNYWWYSLFYLIGLSSIVIFLNFELLTSKISRSILKYSSYLYFVVYFIYFIINFKSIFQSSDIFLWIFTVLLIIGVISIYYFEILSSNRIFNFYKSIYFYFNSALLVWCLITAPLSFYNIYFSTSDWNFVFLKWQILLFANIFMYLTFTFALIFCKPQYDLK